MTIEYDGTNLNGWQIQARNQRTVQGEITKAAQKLLNEKVKLIGSGRTDSGVHALGQVANFQTKSLFPILEIKKALNALLPKDIRVIKIAEVPLNFHAQYNAKRKTYRYSLFLREVACPFRHKYSLHYTKKINLKRMREEAKALIGKKDFRSFMASDPSLGTKQKEKNPIRVIYRIDIKKTKDLLQIDIEANGFLYKMVRNIVGTLLEIGTKKLEPGIMKKILAKKNRNYAGETAKPKGLTLLEVNY